METRANYIAIGAFVLAVIVGLLGMLYWLYRSSEPGATETVRIVFPEPVTGLSTGGGVLFNGIRVGEVASLEFPPGGGDNVIAYARISATAPIKTDTVAKLGFQGLTGVAYISLTGGSENADYLLAAEGAQIPTLLAETSAFTNVLDSAQTVLARLNQTLDEVNGILSENRGDVAAVVDNVRVLSDALAEASPQISGLIDDVAGAGRAIAEVVPQATGVITRTNDILAAVEPQRVASVLANVDAFTAGLPTLIEDARGVVGNVNGLLTRLDDAAGTIGEAVRAVADIVAAVDRNALNAILGDVRATTAVLAARSETLGRFVDDAAAVTADVRAVTAVVAERRDEVAAALDNAVALIGDARGAVQAAVPAIENLGNAIAAVTPDRITAIVADVETVTSTLARESERVATLLQAATTAATSIDQVASNIASRSGTIATAIDDTGAILARVREGADDIPAITEALRARVEEAQALIQAVDSATVRGIVTDVGTFTRTLAERSEAVGTAIDGLAGTLSSTQVIAADLEGRLPQIGQAVDDAVATVAGARAFADRLPQFADALQPGIENLAAVLSAVDPAAVNALVADVGAFTRTLAERSEAVGTAIDGLAGTLSSTQVIAADLEGRLPQIGQAVDDAVATVAGARAFADRLPEFADALQPGIENLSAVLSAVDPAAVNALVADVGAFAEALSAQAEPLGQLIGAARTVATDAAAVSEVLAQRAPALGAIVDDTRLAAGNIARSTATLDAVLIDIAPAIRDVGAALRVVTPARVDDVLTNVQLIAAGLAEQGPAVEAILADARAVAAGARTLAGTLEERAPAIGTAVDDVAATAASLRAAADDLPGLVDTLRPGVENIAAALSAVDAAAVGAIVADAQALAAALGDVAPRLGPVVANVEAVAADAASVSATVAQRSAAIGTALDDAAATAASARAAANGLPGLVEALEPGVQNLSAVLSSVDPALVTGIVEDVRALSSVLAVEAPRIPGIVASVEGTATDVREVAARVRAQLGTLETGLADAQGALADARRFAAELPGLAEQLEPGVANISAALQAVDPAAIDAILGNVRDLSQTLADARDDVDAVVSTAGDVARRIDQVATAVAARTDQIGRAIENAAAFTTNLAAVGPRLDGIVENVSSAAATVRNTVAAIDTTQVNQIVTDISDAARAVGSRAGEIGTAIDNVVASARDLAEGLGSVGGEEGVIRDVLDRAQRIAANLEAASEEVGAVVSRAGGLLDGPAQSLVTEVTGAANAVGNVAAAFASRADQIAGGLGRFSQGGLDDLRALLDQGRATLSEIERAVASFDRNPSRVIFGGSNAPAYTPQRR